MREFADRFQDSNVPRGQRPRPTAWGCPPGDAKTAGGRRHGDSVTVNYIDNADYFLDFTIQ